MNIDDILEAPRKHPLISAVVIPALAILIFIIISGTIDITAIIIGYVIGFLLIYGYYRYLIPLFYKTIKFKP